MKLVRCIRQKELHGIIPHMTWWMNESNEFIFNEYSTGHIMIAEVDDKVYQDWIDNGTFVNGTEVTCINPSTGVCGITVSITGEDNELYLSNKRLFTVNSFNEFVDICRDNDVYVFDVKSIKPEKNSGWMYL